MRKDRSGEQIAALSTVQARALNLVSTPILFLDRENVIFVNKAAEEFLHVSKDHLIGRPLSADLFTRGFSRDALNGAVSSALIEVNFSVVFLSNQSISIFRIIAFEVWVNIIIGHGKESSRIN
jgi:nitrogen-specific signal transduction histidine kinase